MAAFYRTKHAALSRLKAALFHFPRSNHAAADSRLKPRATAEMGSESSEYMGKFDVSKLNKYDSRQFGITSSMIPDHALNVLAILRRQGFDAYLVGGCVRDLILKRTPKDFDVITTANLQKVKRQFHRAQIVGRRFPICMVWIKGAVVEVASFNKAIQNSNDGKEIPLNPIPRYPGNKHCILWEDSIRRDFTINSLYLDPFMHKIYDYFDGMRDLKSLKLRTLIPAQASFTEDCARILRGLRVAGRLGLEVSEDIKVAIHGLSSTIKTLHQVRIMLEINNMLSYGAAEHSLHLLWRFGLLDILLPFQAAYLNRLDGISCHSSSMLMKLFSNMDKYVSCAEPSDSILWIGLLAFHQALLLCPQDTLVVWASAYILRFGWEKGLEFARTKGNHGVHFVPEILESSSNYDVAELTNNISVLARLVNRSLTTLSNSEKLSKLMSTSSLSLSSDNLVFIPKKTIGDVQLMFDVLIQHSEGDVDKTSKNVKSKKNSLSKTRSLLGKIVLDTLSNNNNVSAEMIGLEREDHDRVVGSDGGSVLPYSAVAGEQHRPGKVHMSAEAEMSMMQRDHSEPGRKKRMIHESTEYHGRKQNVDLDRDTWNNRRRKKQKNDLWKHRQN